MEKKLQLLCAILGIVILLISVFFIVNYKYETFENSNMKETKSAIVVKVNEKCLSVMGIENTSDLFTVSYANENNIEFKQGQEILIYFDGMVLSSFPGQIHNVGKIEIVKEESDVSIPDNVLRFYYSSRNNVNVSVSLFEIINYLVLSRLHQLICKMLSVMPAYSRFSINVSFLLFYPPPKWGVYAFVSAKKCSL